MSENKYKGDFYDEDYFERGKESGKGWLENYHWMPLRSSKEANAFIEYLDLNPLSLVLDVGCAKGYLVHAMNIAGIETHGCDISEYALGFVKREYTAWNCEESDSWNGRGYTHVIIKDVLEHLTKEQLPEMMENIAKVTDKIMCVVPMGDNGKYRIPEYHTEISHQIAEDEVWWMREFCKCGWYVSKWCAHIAGLKDNWAYCPNGNRVFVLSKA